MPTHASVQVLPPTSWEEFESLVADLTSHIWKDPDVQRNGRNGQAQHGVDVFGQTGDGRWFGAQVRRKTAGKSQLEIKELRTSAKDAEEFRPKLSRFYLYTTDPNDAAIQGEARTISERNQVDGLFSVVVVSWDEISRKLADFPQLLRKYYPAVFPGSVGTEQMASDLSDIRSNLEMSALDRLPRFSAGIGGTRRIDLFMPNSKVLQISGEVPDWVDWRFSVGSVASPWRRTLGVDVARTSFATGQMNLTEVARSAKGSGVQCRLLLELRFPWHGEVWLEVHGWELEEFESTSDFPLFSFGKLSVGRHKVAND